MEFRVRSPFVVLALVALALIVGCTQRGPDDRVAVIECVGDCVLHTGGLSQATTDDDGAAVVASERLGVAYEVQARNESGEVIPGLQLHYQETENGESLIVISDPDGRYGPLVILGSPEFIAAALAPPASSAGRSLSPTLDEIGSVDRQLVGLVTFTVLVVGATLTALVATKYVGSLFESAFEADVFFEGAVMRDNALEMCRTPAEIATLWRNQADMQDALDGIEFSLLLMPVSAVPLPGVSEIIIMIDAATLLEPSTSSVQIGEEILGALNTETGAHLTMDSRLHVRISDIDSYGTDHAILLAPLEVVALDCDPTEFTVGGYALSITHVPQFPTAFQDVTVAGRLTPPEAGLLVEFDARGTDDYRQLDVAYTNAAGEVSFYVPGGAGGVRDEYVMYVPSLGLSAYDVLVFGASTGAATEPDDGWAAVTSDGFGGPRQAPDADRSVRP